MGGERDTLVVIFNIFLFQIIFSILHFLDFVQNLKRHFFAPRAKTQEDMNTLMGGMELDLAERYSVSVHLWQFFSFYYSTSQIAQHVLHYICLEYDDNFVLDSLVLPYISCSIFLWRCSNVCQSDRRQVSLDGMLSRFWNCRC